MLFSHGYPYWRSSVAVAKASPAVNEIVYVTLGFAVTGGLQPDDFAKVAALGFKSILSNLPDGESNEFPSAAEESALATQAGLGFRHVPATKSEVFDERVVLGVTAALRDLEGPVLAHCASGQRSAIAWAAAAARSQPADCVIEVLKNAGYDLSVLRDELEEQLACERSATIPIALDCHCKEQGERVT